MTLKSMTGFARADGSIGDTRWHWEVRSVNGRGLDVRLRLPPGYEALEPRIREAASRRFTRGSVTVALSLQRDVAQTRIRLNEAALLQVIEASERVRKMVGGEPPRVEGLLGLKGVLEVVEPLEPESEALMAALVESLEGAMDGVVGARLAEGGRLDTVVRQQLEAIEALAASATSAPARSPEAIKARLAEQAAKLIDASPGLDPSRLHQEAVLLATRTDIEEELKRLVAHVAAARELVCSEQAVGRSLDFLAQELNREANTLCSKAIDSEITRIGLSLKSIIDQMREQVQNIE